GGGPAAAGRVRGRWPPGGRRPAPLTCRRPARAGLAGRLAGRPQVQRCQLLMLPGPGDLLCARHHLERSFGESFSVHSFDDMNLSVLMSTLLMPHIAWISRT